MSELEYVNYLCQAYPTQADLVPINVSGLAAEQVAQMREFIEPLGERVFLVGE
jgi:hypothetical protein